MTESQVAVYGHLLSLPFVRRLVFEAVAGIVSHLGELACCLDCAVSSGLGA
jgi:hypothetical protein